MNRDDFKSFIDRAPVYKLDEARLGREPSDQEQCVEPTAPIVTEYRLQSAADLLNAPPLRWLIRGVLPTTGLAAIYGPSGSGKSFLALDLCAAIGDGAPWFQRRVHAAPVTYVCLEGEAGLAKRVHAWAARNKRPLPAAVRFVTQPVDLRYRDDIEALATAINEGSSSSGLVVVDTLNRASPGADENSSRDMSDIIGACKDLQRLTGCLVLLIHHTGKDSAKGLRGHSSLYAALDAAIEVSRDETNRTWSVAKSKDDADGEQQAFKLAVVELGADEDGEEITSCVVEPVENADQKTWLQPPKTGTQKLVFDALKKQLLVSANFGKGHSPLGRPCVLLEDALVEVANGLPCEPRRRKAIARRAIEAMIARGYYGFHDGWMWVK